MNKRINEYQPLELGSQVMIHAYKLNGWLYRAWELPTVIYIDEKMVVLDATKTWIFSSEEKSIRSFKTKVTKTTYWYFFRHEWFNIIATEEANGIKYYINIASPFIYEQEAIKYYDFDLDFKIFFDNTWKEVDINEYFVNANKYGYDKSLMKIIQKTEQKIKQKMEGTFFHDLINKDKIDKMWKKFHEKMKQKLKNKEKYEK